MKYSVLSPGNTGNENVKIIQHHTCRPLQCTNLLKDTNSEKKSTSFSKVAGPKLNLKNRMFIESIFY